MLPLELPSPDAMARRAGSSRKRRGPPDAQNCDDVTVQNNVSRKYKGPWKDSWVWTGNVESNDEAVLPAGWVESGPSGSRPAAGQGATATPADPGTRRSMDGRADDPPHRGRKADAAVAAGAEAPAALTAGQWSGPEPYDLGGGAFTAAVSLTVAAAAVEWTQSPDAVPEAADWHPCVALGAGRWRLDSADGGHRCGPGGGIPRIGLRWRPGRRSPRRSPWSPVSEDRRSLALPAAGRPFPPVLLLAPALAGSGKIGSEVRVAPGRWAGLPPPALDLQWCRDGKPIPGATAAVYVPGAADDRSALTCRVGARSSAGAAVAVTAALPVSYLAPARARRALRGDLRPGQRRAGGAGRRLFHRRGSELRRLRRRCRHRRRRRAAHPHRRRPVGDGHRHRAQFRRRGGERLHGDGRGGGGCRALAGGRPQGQEAEGRAGGARRAGGGRPRRLAGAAGARPGGIPGLRARRPAQRRQRPVYARRGAVGGRARPDLHLPGFRRGLGQPRPWQQLE